MFICIRCGEIFEEKPENFIIQTSPYTGHRYVFPRCPSPQCFNHEQILDITKLLKHIKEKNNEKTNTIAIKEKTKCINEIIEQTTKRR